MLAAGWWKWVVETPTKSNPLFDDTGKWCAKNQSSALIWYLAGAPTSTPIRRTCTIPAGRALFFAVVNLSYGAFLNDPPETRTEEFARSQVSCIAGSTGTVTVDGVAVPTSQLVHESSVVFSVHLPKDNIYGLGPDLVPGLIFSPMVDEGTYALLPPLLHGRHTVRIEGEITDPCPFNQTIDVTYVLTVR